MAHGEEILQNKWDQSTHLQHCMQSGSYTILDPIPAFFVQSSLWSTYRAQENTYDLQLSNKAG